MKLILLLLHLSIMYAQDVITVYSIKSETKPAYYNLEKFELNFLKSIITLYNKKNLNKYAIKVVYTSSYGALFDKFSKMSKSEFACALRAITITKERKQLYDFSYPYMPIKQVLITINEKKKKISNWKNKQYTIGVNKYTVHYKYAMKLVKKYNFQIYYYKSNGVEFNDLYSDKYDFYISDIADTWDNKQLIVLAEFENALLSYYGIMYPKNSELKKQLDPIIKYYIRSPRFYDLIRKTLGAQLVTYYRNISHLDFNDQ